MRKCPNCAEENVNESLFCKQCGRCLLAPNPKEFQRSTTMHTKPYETPEGIAFYDAHRVEKSSVLRLKRSHQTEPSVIVGWIMLLNLVVFVLMSQIVIR